ncbi:uncharacterized protein [Euphorbia lathyris]|uniref:uncharacterized protein n=1 Tax=Euphorbia lathyris TaxID=212925 RepID=UPI003313C238
MADSRSYTKPPFLPKEARLNPSKSHFSSQVSHILCKSIVFLVFIIAIPLFPSQTPEIFNHTLLNKFWELVHLLFIGLAVCYGLFSRRNSDLEFEMTHSNDDSQSSFVSRIFHVSPIFEDGSEIQSGSDEKNAYLSWNSQIYKEESRSRSRSRVSVDNDEQVKIGGFPNSEISFEQDENNVVQAWNSQCFHGESESVVVVSQANYASEHWGKPPNVGGFQPLGLPVRSLNSRIRNSDSSHQFSNGSLSDSSLMGSSNCSPKSIEEEEEEEENFGDQGPVNSDQKLNENVFLPSQNPWLPGSSRTELRERVVPQSNRSHFRKSNSSHQFSNGGLSDSSLMGSSNCSPKSIEQDEEGAEEEEEEENFGDQGPVNSDQKLNGNVFLPSQNQWLPRSSRPELRERVVPQSNRSHFRKSNSSHQFSNGGLSDSSLRGSSNGSPKSIEQDEEENFGDQGPVNSDEKLNPWLPRSDRPELRERVVPLSNRSHFRPRSVDEAQFESFKSHSLKSNASFSSQTSSVSTSPDQLSPSSSSCSDSLNSGTEEPVKMKETEATLSPLATESPKREAPLNAFHLRRYSSSGSLFQKNTQKRAKDDSKNPSHKRREDGQQCSSKPDKKSTNFVRSSSRGKSVRTIRSGAYTPETKRTGDTSKTNTDDNVGKGFDVAKAIDATKKKNVESNYKVPKPTFAEHQMREKKEALENVTVESEHESEPEIDNVRVRLHHKAPPPLSASDSGHDPNEVDKKAAEFIAKFREQIRLQKVASMERSKVIRMSSKYLR